MVYWSKIYMNITDEFNDWYDIDLYETIHL